jgi:hypothetical protein
MRRVGLAGIAGLLVAIVFGVTGATAGESKIVRIDRKTTVQFEDLPGSIGDRVYGQLTVGSGPAKFASRCLASQTVLIRHTFTKPGGGSDPATLVATVKTDAQGAWESTSYEAAGATQLLYDTFQVEVPKHRLTPKGVSPKRVCLKATGFITVPSN